MSDIGSDFRLCQCQGKGVGWPRCSSVVRVNVTVPRFIVVISLGRHN